MVASSPTTSTETTGTARPSWIRGVNIGGWLVLERFITPYMFALTSCHLEGDLCFYPGQLSAPRDHENYCSQYQCKPHLFANVFGENDFPTDEWTLAESFKSKALAKKWLEHHWDNFVTKEDVEELKEAGITHVKVPLPHWIMGDIKPDEPWVNGQWLYFVRFAGWCRELGIEVWPDIHTAPGSQNGFDNSGKMSKKFPTCEGWLSNKENIERSLKAVKQISEAIVRDSLRDVVTGFGVLNEPFECDPSVIKPFYNEALHLVREIMGENTAVYIGDVFNATHWNDKWWTDEERYSNTFLDSHYYHVFGETTRALTPKQQVAYVCQTEAKATQSCCYADAPENTKPSKGISRLVGEWSAACDTLPIEKLKDVMKGIEEHFEAPELKRKIPVARQKFLKDYTEAQIVTYEAANVGVSRGWFYWTLKMEGGAFAEWDFLRGWREKWIPSLPPPNQTAESLFGTCKEIAEKTVDDDDILDEFPDPQMPGLWSGPDIDDDYVISHAGSVNSKGKKTTAPQKTSAPIKTEAKEGYPTGESYEKDTADEKSDTNAKKEKKKKSKGGLFPLLVLGFFCYAIWRVFFQQNSAANRGNFASINVPQMPQMPNPLQNVGRRGQYTDLDQGTSLNV